MPVLSNILPKQTPSPGFVAWPYIDTLYDYDQYLGSGAPIATLPQAKWGATVGIVGAGAAGLVAAYELLKIGAQPVIFEASERIGGRAHSQPFIDADGSPSKTDFAELGSMRFPPSGKTFFHYVNLFKLAVSGLFPDPGKVPTVLYYENEVIPWPAGQTAPKGFEKISADWSGFVGGLITPLYNAWQVAQQNGDWQPVVTLWQGMIDLYKNKSFFEVVQTGLPDWTDEDLDKFGALGIGSGGFGPLYSVNFLELMRIVVNMWEDNQQLLTDGVSGLMRAFYETPVTTPGGQSVSLQQLGAVKFNMRVDSIRYLDNRPTLYFSDDCAPPQAFDAVILATTTRSMEVVGLTLPPAQGPEIVDQDVKVAIRNLHLMDSSKLFIRTRTKFWKDATKNIPQNIQTDELPRGVYTLDYPQTEHGIVLVSYVWGDDSSKLLPLSKTARLELFKKSIAKASPEFAAHLVPMNGVEDIIKIDWEDEPFYYGAFKLQYPGQEPNIQAAYFQFLTVLDSTADRGVYLAGDSVSWSGGWTEGALQTGLNAACAAAQRIGASVRAPSPLTQNPNLYRY